MRYIFIIAVLSGLIACATQPVVAPPRPKPESTYTGERHVGDDVVEFRPIMKPPPIYPRDLLEKGIEGWVVVEYTILSSGATGDVRVKDESPVNLFSSAATDAAKKFIYKPRVVNGSPVSVRGVTTVIGFTIE